MDDTVNNAEQPGNPEQSDNPATEQQGKPEPERPENPEPEQSGEDDDDSAGAEDELDRFKSVPMGTGKKVEVFTWWRVNGNAFPR